MKIKGIEHDQEVEILKAVAQAWHGRNSSSSQDSSSGEFDARRRNFKTKPTRFRMEAIMDNKVEVRGRRRRSSSSCTNNNARWDFQQSLWDSYEIVSVSKKLEAGLLQVDNPFNSEPPVARIPKKESKNSLRNLFNLMSSRRFDNSSIPPPEEEEDI